MELLTPRLILRTVCLEDAAAYFEMFSDAESTKYWWEPAWTNFDQATSRIQHLVSTIQEPELALSVVLRENGEVIGTGNLFQISKTCRRAEIGYSIRRDYWGQGFGSEVVAGIVEHAFATLGLNRLEADIDPNNVGSAKVLERNGFHREGYMPERWIVGGVVSDTAFYGLLAKNWVKPSRP